MMDDSRNEFLEYLWKIKDTQDDKCPFCSKSPDQIRKEYFEYMEDPDEEFENVDLDDLIIMTYKIKKPVCAGCLDVKGYFKIA